MPADNVKVLNFWISMFGMRVIIALKEKGIQYEYIEEDLLNKSQLLLSSNPVHEKIPVLIHNGNVVCESLIIVQYVDEVWPAKGKCLMPKDPYQRTVARFWGDYIDKKFHNAGFRLIRSPEGELKEQAQKDMTEAFVTLDSAFRDVAGSKPYFGGDSIGLVDIAFAPFICWLSSYEELGNYKFPDEKQCPHLHAWMKRVVQCPSVKESMTLAPPEKVLQFCKDRIIGGKQ